MHRASEPQAPAIAPAPAVDLIAPAPAPESAPAPAPVEPVAPVLDESSGPEPPLLFEIAWEVCWQLGGIYTVLRTKAAAMLERWGDRYCLIGPYNPRPRALEFEEQPTEGIIRETLDRLRDQGIPCHFGRWLIPGRPRVILLDYRARYRDLDDDKYLMWKDHGISTPTDDGEVNEVVAFGFAVAEFFRELARASWTTARSSRTSTSGWAASRSRASRTCKLPVTTVFTTHATLLGRYLASDNPYFYDHLPFLNARRARRRKYNIYPQLRDRAGRGARVDRVHDRQRSDRVRGRETARPHSPTRSCPTG